MIFLDSMPRLETVIKNKGTPSYLVGTVFVFKNSWYSQFVESLLCLDSTKRLLFKIDSMYYLFLCLVFFFISLANNPSS